MKRYEIAIVGLIVVALGIFFFDVFSKAVGHLEPKEANQGRLGQATALAEEVVSSPKDVALHYIYLDVITIIFSFEASMEEASVTARLRSKGWRVRVEAGRIVAEGPFESRPALVWIASHGSRTMVAYTDRTEPNAKMVRKWSELIAAPRLSRMPIKQKK